MTDDTVTVALTIPKLNADCKLAQQRSMFLLKDLKQRYPNPDNLRPEHRSMFISLVRVLIAILPVDYLGGIQDTAVPILVDKRGSFFWLTEGGNREAWLVDGDDHNEIKRFFPDLPLVVGDSKKGLSDLLNLKQVTLNKKVKYTEYFLGSPLAFKLTQEIKPIVHKLCAIAEISRLSTADSMADRVRRAWFQSGSIPPLMHSKDTYVEVIAEGTRNESTQWRLNKFEDVFYLPGSGKDPGQIVFDTASLEIGPPLWHFGEALALQLTNNPSLGPLFAESLAAYREGTLDSLLERRLATEAVRRWRKELEPIAGVERERLLIILHTYIKQPDSCLDAGKIRCKDIREGNRFKTVGELMACIEIQLGTLKKYLPRITIEDDNINEWDKWYSIWHKRLWVWIRHNTLNREEYLERDLQEHIKLKLKDILFDPQDSVTQWLSGLESFRQPSGGLEITLANFVSETFTPVSIAPVHYTAASWKIGRGMAGGSKSGPEGKLENIDIFDEQIAKSAWGDQAEKALLNWVKANTQAIIRQDPEMKKTLLTVLPNKTKTYKTVSEALDQQDYDKALHVAELWSGLGFDIIGLEKDSLSQQCFAVRYECKGLPSADRRVHVHLSRREIGVARKVTMDGGPGFWKLIGVKPSGAAVDLTDAIQDLRINNSHILRSLHDKGLEHDGLRLVIEQR